MTTKVSLNLRELVENIHFPSISEDNNTVRGEFLFLLGQCLRTLHTDVLTDMGLPVDICEKLNFARQLEEQRFLSRRGVLSDNGLDSLTHSLSGEQFVRDLFNNTATIHSPYRAAAPNNFDIWHDSWIKSNNVDRPKKTYKNG